MKDEELKLLLRYDLQFFAKDGPGGEKTEDATPKKLGEARKEGQVAKSKELITSLMLLALFVLVKFYIGNVGQQMIECFSKIFNVIPKTVFSSQYGMRMDDVTGVMQTAMTSILNIAVPFFIVAMIIGILGNALQQKWLITTKPLRPKFGKMNPINGIKKIFSVKQLVEIAKSLAMLIVMGVVIYNTIKDKLLVIFTFYDISIYEAVAITGDILVDIGMKISLVFIIIGFIDLIYQRRKFKKDMKMTKQV